ncbi:MAG: hypothetical protein ACREPJ_14120 [Rhodanobacteraceae bacterium]
MNNGGYNTATPFYGTNYSLAHMGLPAALEKNIHTYYYSVDHMRYLNPKAMPQVAKNMDAFIEKASAG